MKECLSCHVEKPIVYFPKNGFSPYGEQRFRATCKVCDYELRGNRSTAVYARNWRNKNVERAKLCNRRAYQRRVGLPIEPLEAKNPKFKGPDHYKKYRSENIGASNAITSKRRAFKLEATPIWADSFIILEAYKLASLRNRLTGITWNVDHIIPLLNKSVCGLHCEFNLQVIPKQENLRKNNRFIPYSTIGLSS